MCNTALKTKYQDIDLKWQSLVETGHNGNKPGAYTE